MEFEIEGTGPMAQQVMELAKKLVRQQEQGKDQRIASLTADKARLEEELTEKKKDCDSLQFALNNNSNSLDTWISGQRETAKRLARAEAERDHAVMRAEIAEITRDVVRETINLKTIVSIGEQRDALRAEVTGLEADNARLKVELAEEKERSILHGRNAGRWAVRAVLAKRLLRSMKVRAEQAEAERDEYKHRLAQVAAYAEDVVVPEREKLQAEVERKTKALNEIIEENQVSWGDGPYAKIARAALAEESKPKSWGK